MTSSRNCLAAAVLATLACATPAQQAFVEQSGNGDAASIEQNNAAGLSTFASIFQSGGAANSASVLQTVDGAGSPGGLGAAATVTQQGTFGDTAKVTQLAVSGSALTVTQSGGSNSSADVLQFGVSNSRIRVNQGSSFSDVLVQQTGGSSGAGAGAELFGNGGHITLLQGQPTAGGVFNTGARVFQYGDANSGLSVQSGVSNSNAYTSQGSPQMVGFYFDHLAGVWVEVDGSVLPSAAVGSTATTFQTGGNAQTAYILQYGFGLNASITQSGDQNLGGVLQSGSGHLANITQSGVAGQATVAQYGTGMTSTVFQSGVGNTATVKQR